jgi:hypothetical protein
MATRRDHPAPAKAISHIALPLNLMSALSPPVLVGLPTHFGGGAILWLAIPCSWNAHLILLLLARRRPATGLVSTT